MTPTRPSMRCSEPRARATCDFLRHWRGVGDPERSLSFAGMHKLTALLAAGSLGFASCCSWTARNAIMFHPWGWEDAKHAKAHLGAYKHVLVARIDGHHYEDGGPHQLTPHHFEATVVRSFKGDWRVSERIAFVHYVDAPAPTHTPDAPRGDLVFVFTNEKTDAEIALDTGEFGAYGVEDEPALEYLFSRERSR